MSVQATSWVWENAPAEGSALLVLLAVADAANREGEHSCQSVATIARMARVSERTAQRALRDLQAQGLLESSGVDRRYRTTVYGIPGVKGVTQGAGGDTPGTPRVSGSVAEGDTAMAPDPSTTPGTTPQGPQGAAGADAAAPARPADAIAKAVYDATDKGVRYMAVRQVAGWAVKNRPQVGTERVVEAMVALHNAGKPITVSLVAQVLDGIVRPAVLAADGAGRARDVQDRAAYTDHWANGGAW